MESSLPPTESLKAPESNFLEGAVLIHGFRGNTNDVSPYTTEVETLKLILESGSILSPNLQLDSSRNRLTSFDDRRICLHVWKKDSRQNKSNYVMKSFFAIPASAAEGTIISIDPAMDDQTIALNHPEGVSIPLSKGLLFLDEHNFYQLEPTIKEVAQKLDISPEEYINQHIVILPESIRRDGPKLWKAVSRRIKPASKISVKIHHPKSSEDPNDLDFTKSLYTEPVASMQDLGKSSIIEGKATSSEFIQAITDEISTHAKHIEECYQNIGNHDLFQLASLNDPDKYLFDHYQSHPNHFEKIKLLQTLDPENPLLPDLQQKAALLRQVQKTLRDTTQEILKNTYPDAKPLPSRPRQRITEPLVYIKPDGSYGIDVGDIELFKE